MNKNNLIEDKIKDLISRRTNQNFDEQVGEAALAVTEIDSVDSFEAFQKVQNRIKKSDKFTLVLNALYRVAAVLFIPLLVASGILFYKQFNLQDKQQFAFQEISTPSGVRSQVVLPDGTKVWLNAESTIKFLVPFDKTSRDVSLSGEAFFDVQKNTNLPFVVKSGNVNITVLGTKFNCKAFENENSIEIVLAEGEVRLNTVLGYKRKEVIMNPGDRIVFDKTSNNLLTTHEKIDKYIAWHGGKLVFDETPMPEVALQIGRWYGVDVIIEDPIIRNYRITTTFENESLNQVVELLKLSSPIEIKYLPATINKANNKHMKSKVIFSKKNKSKF